MRSTVTKGLCWLVVTALAGHGLGVATSDAGELRVGVGVQNITADAPTIPVHDPLFAKAIVLDDGGNRVVIVAVDLIFVSDSLVRDVRRRIREELDIDESSVLLSATHNHHARGQVAEDAGERIARAVAQAWKGMTPARIASGKGQEERITMNRRLRLDSGKHWTIRRATPSPADDRVVALGPVDTEIGLLRIDSMEGKPLALVYHFAGHPYGGVPRPAVTADFPGFASRVLESAWPGAVAVFLQGAAGDITPVGYKNFDTPAPTERLGTMVGMSTLQAAQELRTSDGASIKVLRETIELPVRTDLPQRIASFVAQQEEILQFFAGVGCGTHGAGTALNFKSFLPLYLKHLVDPAHPADAAYLYDDTTAGQEGLRELDADNRLRLERYLKCIAAMEQLIRIRTNLHGLQRQLEKPRTEPFAVEIQAVRIGEFALVTFPGEAFAEIGLRIKQQSPFPHTFLAAYANGSVGYAPTADAYEQEAYEDVFTWLAPAWQAIYEEKALGLLGRLKADEQRP